MPIVFNIDLNEIQRATDVNESLAKLTSGIGTVLLILFFPILFIMHCISLYLTIRANRELSQAASILESVEGSHEAKAFPDLQKVFQYSQKWLAEHREKAEAMRKHKGHAIFLQGFRRRFLEMFDLMQQIYDSSRRSLYVDGAQHSFSKEEIEDYSEFFGPDEDYEEDTFLQLNPNG